MPSPMPGSKTVANNFNKECSWFLTSMSYQKQWLGSGDSVKFIALVAASLHKQSAVSRIIIKNVWSGKHKLFVTHTAFSSLVWKYRQGKNKIDSNSWGMAKSWTFVFLVRSTKVQTALYSNSRLQLLRTKQHVIWSQNVYTNLLLTSFCWRAWFCC